MKIGRLAPWYRWIEYAAFGRALEKRRFAFLPRLFSARRVLILGEGDGRTLARLLDLAPAARFDVVEVSPEMIALALRRTHNLDRIVFHCQDATSAPWPAVEYDAIVTNFILDCFSEQEARALIRRLAAALSPDGIWLIAEFALPDQGWRRLHAQIWIWTMYRFFHAFTRLDASELPPIATLMRDAGMQRTERQTSRAGMMISEVWQPIPPPSAAPRI